MKVKWETLALPLTQGGLGVTDPKSQSEALLAKLLIRGLAPGGEPWKELVWHNAGQTKLPLHGKGPSTPDLNWLLVAPKLKRLKRSMWRSIVEAWLNARPGLCKSNPTSLAEILRQPIFGNLSILNQRGIPLGVGGQREGNSFAQAGYTRVKDFWNETTRGWKSLTGLGMSHHPFNRESMETITSSIPWRPDEHEDQTRVGDWIANPAPVAGNLLDWIYLVLAKDGDTAMAFEFQRTTPSGRIQLTSNQALRISTVNHQPVRVLSQENPKATLKVARDPPAPGKKALLYWIFDFGFIQDLPWDPGEWHWQPNPPLTHPWEMPPSSVTQRKEATPAFANLPIRRVW